MNLKSLIAAVCGIIGIAGVANATVAYPCSAPSATTTYNAAAIVAYSLIDGGHPYAYVLEDYTGCFFPIASNSVNLGNLSQTYLNTGGSFVNGAAVRTPTGTPAYSLKPKGLVRVDQAPEAE